MSIIRRIPHYLNPIAYLGDRRYSIVFPLIVNIIVCILSEGYAYGIAHNPMAVGDYIIFINVALIIYFSFREGIRGGFVTTLITIMYYLYIIYTRNYRGQEYSAGMVTTFILACLYFAIAFIIGWLKEQIDKLIEIQSDERKRLETIIEQLPVGAIITDNTGKITHINKNVNRMLGFKIPVGFKIGVDIPKNIKINGSAAIPTQAPSFLALNSGKQVNGREFFVERRDGVNKFFQVNSAPVQNDKKKIIAVATIISDITQRKAMEKQKDNFISMASHELKTPITSLKMFIDLQQKKIDEKDSEKSKYYNERIRDQANRLIELTNDLLDVSRIQTGKLNFNLEEFNLTEVVYDTVEGLQGTTLQHQIMLDKKSKHLVKGDKFRIYQVVVNLISNAIKYSPQGKKILIKIKKIKKQVVVSVQDFGIGIDKEEQQRIFDRLYQINNPKEKIFPGLGLGLYISKEIIVRHKGKLWVESIKGKGSTFYFSLPVTPKN